MSETIAVSVMAISFMAVVYFLVTRPLGPEIDEDEMRALINEQVWANTTKVITVYKPVAMQRETESYYDRYRRLTEAKENDN